ncbi:MAG: phosphopantothenoylcysteine decarboxylase [Firmicutes bacterium]|jgi:phosphopantothenoylcysteine decarboxylase/phosphopantothenoylcysteine decarboxylase/phosphopantothenate--cysteine ligase|nr:phosphopantothenoylcysteine decarboxylase [Bacillota bacterium]MBQ5441298.1 phosphopantothenoylcysteine decarboxylase [Bacillota bacterium]MCR4708684.1 phosphopantothenoylcysteine decarboxylase [Clostridiales bacterium]
MSNIILGVTGSISVYKACDIANELTKEGHSVKVIMTEAGQKFVTPLTFMTLTKNRVYTDAFDNQDPKAVEHIALATEADLFVIAPASADIIAKAAAGFGDNMLTTTLLAYRDKPVLICPAMNTNMYENKVTQRNIGILKDLGFEFVEPKEAYLACGTVGKGALASVDVILERIRDLLK